MQFMGLLTELISLYHYGKGIYATMIVTGVALNDNWEKSESNGYNICSSLLLDMFCKSLALVISFLEFTPYWSMTHASVLRLVNDACVYTAPVTSESHPGLIAL